MDFSLETIFKRVSTRTFDGVPLSPEETAALTASFAETSPGPFGGRPRLLLVTAGAAGLGGTTAGAAASGKIGTYGLIAQAPAFIVGAVAKGPGAMEDFGYALEGAVLRATELDLGSCWIGGLFDRGAAARALGLAEEELIPSVIAVGHAATGRSFAERLTRRAAGAGTRRDARELFFEGDFTRPLAVPEGDPWFKVLEAVRLGPSASNKQPWRILRSAQAGKQAFHLFLDEDRLYNSALGAVRIQNIDMGIAMRHFEAAAKALRLPGGWSKAEAPALESPASYSYIATWS
jgi:nitroreductase